MKGKDNITINHKGRVINNKLMLYDVNLYQDDIERHNNLDIIVRITLDEEDHTPEQMKFFRGHITNCALNSETFGGYTKKEFQDAMKYEFLSEKVDIKQKDGSYKEVTIVPSLGNLSLKKMKWFIERVIQFLAEENIIVEK